MCPDVLTKTKQGKSFRLFRSKIINVPLDYDDKKEQTNNGSDITVVLKHKTEKKVENNKITGVRITKQIQQSMDDPSRQKIAGVCWGMLKINQQRFNNIGDVLGADIPKS